MQVEHVQVDRTEAKRLYQEYKKHQHYSTPIDAEVQRTYQLLAQGRLIIRAIESVKLAGLNDQGLPKLALCKADAVGCRFRMNRDGSAVMRDDRIQQRMRRIDRTRTPIWSPGIIDFPIGSFQPQKEVWNAMSLVPAPPLHLRPKRGLANYHILWEAEWTPVPPRDPYLLRRIGKSDAWLVCAHWDLTEAERAVLATRIR